MISQIGFLVEKSLKLGMKSACSYAAGVTLGAASLGACLGTAGSFFYWLIGSRMSYNGREVGLLIISILCILGSLVDLSILPCPVLGPKKQLPRHYMEVFGPVKTGFIWGLSVGFALNTRFGYFIYCIIILWAFLTGYWLNGLIIMAIYGMSQGILLVFEILLIGVSKKITSHDGLLGYNRTSHFFQVSSLCLMAVGIANLLGWFVLGSGETK